MQEYLDTYGYFAILLFTFLEGETIVILAGIAAYQGYMNVYLVAVSGFCGSFLGDQLYYAIGRHYGTPLLNRWPHLRKRIEWVFDILRRYETLYILSFRFIYGVRNISPFVIGMTGISRLKFMTLNCLAAMLWASTFSAGGYFFGHAIERILGENQTKALLVLGGIALTVGVVIAVRKRLRKPRPDKAAETPETAAE
ncbi:MAG: DedA family protein [Alphaproteobacteria bacterium]